jgi:ATP synthase protein I
MVANYARIVRRSAVVAAVAAVLMVALGARVSGTKGLIGAVIGVAIVALFFGTSVIAVGRAARVSPQAMMATGMITYIVKTLILLVLIGEFQYSAAFNPKVFGLTMIVCILAYSAAQVIWARRLKMLYVEPDGER